MISLHLTALFDTEAFDRIECNIQLIDEAQIDEFFSSNTFKMQAALISFAPFPWCSLKNGFYSISFTLVSDDECHGQKHSRSEWLKCEKIV